MFLQSVVGHFSLTTLFWSTVGSSASLSLSPVFPVFVYSTLGTWLFWPQTGPGLSVPFPSSLLLCPCDPILPPLPFTYCYVGVTSSASPALSVDPPSTCGAVALQLFVSLFLLCLVVLSLLCILAFFLLLFLSGLKSGWSAPPSSLRSLSSFSFCHSRVWCLVFLAADWSRISSATLSCSSHSTCSPFLSWWFLSTLAPVWYLWPQTGQGYHFAGPSSPPSPCFAPSTVSGRRLVRGCCSST